MIDNKQLSKKACREIKRLALQHYLYYKKFRSWDGICIFWGMDNVLHIIGNNELIMWDDFKNCNKFIMWLKDRLKELDNVKI